MVNDFKIMHTILSTLAAAGPAPQLKALLLYHYEDVEAYDVFRPAELRAPALAPFGGIAPALTHVALWGVHVDWDACHFLSGLDELELAYHTYDVRPSYPTFLSILRASPALRTLTLCLSGPAGTPQDWPDPAPDPVALPSVENLVLAFHELPYITALLRRLHFPNVTSLALDFDDEDYGPLLDQLAQAPPATGARPLLEGLRALKLSGMQCGDAAVARFYAALPNLTTLNLNCRHLPPAFVAQLAPADADADDPTKLVLPSLEMLTTTGVRGVEMRALVEARRARPLKRVLMEREDDVAEADEADEAWLRARVDEFGFFEGSEDESEDDELALEDVDSDSDEEE
ncbi:hypothetical protein OF83DRAFT_1143199 [Amylostereum chailletii]|nr:hypothetical protein OF83DRAFT_1143199 [Amylostereum chailletii]